MHDRNETTMRRIANAALAAAFAVGIGLPCVGTLFHLDTGGLPGENRAMAPAPSLAKGKLKEYPQKAEAWFNDHFGLRNSLVLEHSLVALKVFGVSSSNDVAIGRDGWLFYAADRILESRRGVLPFTEEELRGWQSRLEERRDWLASQGIRYVFMIAPEKSSLYAEYLPDALAPAFADLSAEASSFADLSAEALAKEEASAGQDARGKSATRLDQLLAWMRARSTVEMLDLRESLRAAKADVRIWHRTDTHWNDEGAFAAFQQIEAWLQSKFPAVRPLDRAEFDRKAVVGLGGDLAGMLALMSRIPEERIVLTPRTPSPVRPAELTEAMNKRAWIPTRGPSVYECAEGEVPRGVILRDSFFQQVQPFLARHFQRSAFVWWAFPPDVIADEKPDVVIEEMVERVLSRPDFLPVNESPIAGYRAGGH